MIATMEIDNLPIGKTIDYHIGDLANDREENTELSKLASHVFGRSTSCEGTREFEIFQDKIELGRYRYIARRIRHASELMPGKIKNSLRR